MKCFYHNDNDGKAAAFCVYAWVGIHDNLPDTPFDFVPMDYGRPFPLADIRPNEQVYIVDYSITPDEMRQLLAITKDVTWIDHHKTAIAKYDGFEVPIRGIRKDGEAACSLAWKYVHWWTARGAGPERFDAGCPVRGLEVPLFIELIADRDVWAWQRGAMTAEFHAGLALYDTGPGSEVWWQLLDREIEPLPPPNTGNAEAKRRGDAFWEKLLAEGRAILRYNKQRYADLCSAIAFDADFEGHRCRAINIAKTGSEVFGGEKGALPEGYDICVTFYHDGQQFTVSLYSNTVDVSEIAKQYGGGGHRGAAGFQCGALPFSLRGLPA